MLLSSLFSAARLLGSGLLPGSVAGGYGNFASYDAVIKNAENTVKDIFETHPFIQISQGTEKEKHRKFES